MSLAVATARLLLLCGAVLTPLPCLAIPAEDEPPSDLRLNDPKPTTILARIIHERFCCNRRSAATTSLRPAGSRRGSAISRRIVMNNAG